MGVDFGSGFAKAAYLAPGEAELLPTVLNDMSERKTANVIAFRPGEGAYVGPHALKPLLNMPERGFAWLQPLLGAPWEDSVVQQATLPFRTTGLVRDAESGGVSAVFSDSTDAVQPVAHLAGIVLAKIMKDAEADAGRRIRDAVLTVPPHWGTAQRQALLDAAAIAGVPVAGLISDIGAAALYYGAVAGARESVARTIVFFDSGATHSAAALVRIDPQHREQQGAEPVVLIDMLRVAADTVLCGREIDRAAAGVLARNFAKAHGRDADAPLFGIVPAGKALNRLFVEALNVKEILTVNTEIRAVIDELVGSESLPATIVTRAELEDACAAMRGRAPALVQRLLAEAGISVDAMDAIIPVGGNARVPFVQAELRAAFGDARLQTVMNFDESIAKGAALYAASLARLRVRPLRFRDMWLHPVTLSYSPAGAPADAAPTVVDVYGSSSAIGSHRALTFPGPDGIVGTLMEDGRALFNVRIGAADKIVADWIAQTPGRVLVSARVKLWVDLSQRSAAVALKDAPAVLVEYRDAPAEGQAEEPVAQSVALPLKDYAFEALYTRMRPETIGRLASVIRAEREAERRAAARAVVFNDLETSKYRLRDLLEDGTGPNGFREYVDEKLRAALDAAIAHASHVLDMDDGSDDHEQRMRAALQDLIAAESPVGVRISDHSDRPAQVAQLRKHAAAAIDWVAKVRTDKPDPAMRAQTDAELTSLVTAVQDALAWLSDAEKRQATIPLSAEPHLSCDDIRRRAKTIMDAHAALLTKVPPPPAPVEQPAARPPAEEPGPEAPAADQPAEPEPAAVPERDEL